MKIGQLCGKWELPFHVSPEAEEQLAKGARSYLHYIAAHQPLVAAKCLATEWLLTGLTQGLTLREYFGGAGLVSVIARELMRPSDHHASDKDARCAQQLKGLLGAAKGEAIPARAAIEATGYYDVHALDFPRFTALMLREKKPWEVLFGKLFSQAPKYVLLTDTACSYLSVHKGKYSAFLKNKIETRHDYTQALSLYLYQRWGYGIHRAAYRARNAAYFLLAAGHRPVLEQDFPTKGNEHGFVWLPDR